MKHKPVRLLVMLAVFMMGCGSVQQIVQATPTLTFTETPTLTSTPAATPTRKPTQTMTPDVAATMQVEKFSELMQNYFDSAFLATVKGEYYSLEDSIQNLAKKGYYKWTIYDVNIRNFILRTNVRMSTANNPSSSTGCGVVFRTVGDFNESIFIQQDGYLFYGAGDTSFKSRYYGKFDNPAEFELIVMVNEKSYQVHINGEKALNGDSILDPSKGGIGFAVQSGSDEDFGSQCTFANNDLWAIKSK